MIRLKGGIMKTKFQEIITGALLIGVVFGAITSGLMVVFLN